MQFLGQNKQEPAELSLVNLGRQKVKLEGVTTHVSTGRCSPLGSGLTRFSCSPLTYSVQRHLIAAIAVDDE
jgi:hypothetical protein